MHHTKHSVARMNQRGFVHAMTRLICAYGTDKGDKIILTQKAAIARLNEARAEKVALELALDAVCADLSGVMHQLHEIEAELTVLMKLIDKHGGVVVMVGDNLITVYGLH